MHPEFCLGAGDSWGTKSGEGLEGNGSLDGSVQGIGHIGLGGGGEEFPGVLWGF